MQETAWTNLYIAVNLRACVRLLAGAQANFVLMHVHVHVGHIIIVGSYGIEYTQYAAGSQLVLIKSGELAISRWLLNLNLSYYNDIEHSDH